MEPSTATRLIRRPATIFLVMAASLFVLTGISARVWHDGTWGIPNPDPPLAALALVVTVSGWWIGTRLGEGRLILAAFGAFTLAMTAAVWFVYLLLLARAPCAAGSETFAQCCEGWGFIAGMGPGAMSVVFAVAATVAGIRRRGAVVRARQNDS